MSEQINDPTPEELAVLLSSFLLGGMRTFRHGPDCYEHTISAADPALEDWPEEIDVDGQETKNYK